MTDQDDYDFGSSGRGSLLRKEVKSYQNVGNAIVPFGDAVYDGAGTTLSQTTYAYDETQGPGHAALQTTSGLPGRSGGVGSARGNVTTISQWINSPSSTASTAFSYDDSGQVLSKLDARGNTTTYSYDPATNGFLTHAAYPMTGSGLAVATSAKYDAASGILQTTTDPNGQVTTYKYYDRLLRPAEIDYPDGGQTKYWFTDANTFWTGQPIGNGSTSYYVTHTDGYARLDRAALSNGLPGNNTWDQVDSCFDATAWFTFRARHIETPDSVRPSSVPAAARLMCMTHWEGPQA